MRTLSVSAMILYAREYLVFQLLTNGWLTGRGIVQYDESQITGVRLANAPVEDIAFGFSLIVLTLSIWQRLSPDVRHTTS